MNKYFGLIMVGAILFVTFYTIKSQLGIDLDPAHHLSYYFFHPASLVTLAEAGVFPSIRIDSKKRKNIAQTANIVVDFNQNKGVVNRKILGLNVLGVYSPGEPNPYSNFGAGLWDPRNNVFVKEPMELVKKIRVSTLRFPGGLGTYDYDWKKTIEKNRSEFLFGLDEFMQMSKELKAEPVFTLSYFTGEPKDAADLVEYLNSAADNNHPWAIKRASKGHQEPYGVKYFEVGNEIDNGKVRSVTAEEYAASVLQYYDAIKKIDPQVKVGAVLSNKKWNETVLKIISDKVDFVILHIYPTPVWGKDLESMPIEEIFSSSLAIPAIQIDFELKALQCLLQKTSSRDIPVFVTEFNGGFAQDDPVPYRHSLGNALVNAELIRILTDPSNNVAMAHQWNFINEYWGMIANGFKGDEKDLSNSYYKRPNFYAFDLYANHFGDELILSEVISPHYDVGQDDFYKEFIRSLSPGSIEGHNSLEHEWNIFPVEGIEAKQEGDVLSLNFGHYQQWNYFHSVKLADVKSDTFYKLSGFIKTIGLMDDSGVSLEVQDARGWDKTHSAMSTAKVKGNTDWQYVDAIYKTLPDALRLKVFARRIGDHGPLKGKALFKDVKLQKFVPQIASKVPYLSVNASKSSDGKKVYLMVVNKNLNSPETATIELKNFPADKIGMAWILNGPSVDATNEVNHDRVKITHRIFNIFGEKFVYTFEPHSVTAIEIHRIDS